MMQLNSEDDYCMSDEPMMTLEPDDIKASDTVTIVWKLEDNK